MLEPAHAGSSPLRLDARCHAGRGEGATCPLVPATTDDVALVQSGSAPQMNQNMPAVAALVKKLRAWLASSSEQTAGRAATD